MSESPMPLDATRKMAGGLHLFWAALAAVAILGVVLAANTHPSLWVYLSYYAAIP